MFNHATAIRIDLVLNVVKIPVVISGGEIITSELQYSRASLGASGSLSGRTYFALTRLAGNTF